MTDDCGCAADCTCHGQRFEQDEHRAAPDSAPFESPPVLRVVALLFMPWREVFRWPGLLLTRGGPRGPGSTRS
jgi:hypothetical protein